MDHTWVGVQFVNWKVKCALIAPGFFWLEFIPIIQFKWRFKIDQLFIYSKSSLPWVEVERRSEKRCWSKAKKRWNRNGKHLRWEWHRKGFAIRCNLTSIKTHHDYTLTLIRHQSLLLCVHLQHLIVHYKYINKSIKSFLSIPRNSRKF